jgi:organic radical activating enzyme
MLYEKFCKAPLISLSVRNGNRISICANSSFFLEVPRGLNLSDALELSGWKKYFSEHFSTPQLPSCHVCLERRALNVRTQIDYFEELHEQVIKENQPPTGRASDIELLDLNLSRICNLKCRMCSSLRSTSWESDQNKLRQKLPWIYDVVECGPNEIEIDLKKFTSLKYIVLKGGEPLLDPGSLKFLRELVESGFSKKLSLTVFTNGIFVKKYLMLLKEFKITNLIFSFEAIDKMYSYIRGAQHDFAELKSNLFEAAREEKINISLMYTPQAYNIFDFEGAAKFIVNEVAPKLSQKFSDQDLLNIFGNVLHNPKYLEIKVLPESVRNKVSESIKQQEDLPKVLREQFSRLLSGPQNKIEFQRFKEYTLELDAVRGENILSVEPRFSAIF